MESAISTALRLLTRKQLTTKQLQERLKRKKFQSAEIEDAVTRLKEWKYLDDEYYALVFCKLKKEKNSRRKVVYELQEAGIEESLIDIALYKAYTEEDEAETCSKLAHKIFKQESDKWKRKYRYNDNYNKIPKELFLKRKTGEKLIRQGYPYGLVSEVLNRIISHSS